jgi:hypothetical protein
VFALRLLYRSEDKSKNRGLPGRKVGRSEMNTCSKIAPLNKPLLCSKEINRSFKHVIDDKVSVFYFFTANGNIMGIQNVRYPRKKKKQMKKLGNWHGAHNLKGIPGKIL